MVDVLPRRRRFGKKGNSNTHTEENAMRRHRHRKPRQIGVLLPRGYQELQEVKKGSSPEGFGGEHGSAHTFISDV